MIEKVMRERRSVRRFKPEPVAREVIERLIEAAVCAPSASNRQPWRFVVITRRALIDALASDVRAAVARIGEHVPEESRAGFAGYGEYFTRFERAPCVIVVLSRVSAVLSHLVSPTIAPDDRARIEAMERTSAMVSASLAVENLLLMAHALGLGASAMTGPLVASSDWLGRLEVPAGWEMMSVIAVGHPDETPAATERKPVARVTRWIP